MSGFFDIHKHGGGGYSFDDIVIDAANENVDAVNKFNTILQTHEKYGTTHHIISLITSPIDIMCERIKAVKKLMSQNSSIIGIHLEGPFISPQKKGAHNPEYLINPTDDVIDRIIEAGNLDTEKYKSKNAVKQITIAPELTNALGTISKLRKFDIVSAVGHTEATYQQTKDAIKCGATNITHAFNAMNPITGRESGPLLAAVEEGIYIELIADGIHVSDANIRMLFELAPDKICLVTDAMGAAGASDGEYMLGDLAVTVKNGKATLTGTNTIAGSTLTMQNAVNKVISCGVDSDIAIKAASHNPARLFGIENLIL